VPTPAEPGDRLTERFTAREPGTAAGSRCRGVRGRCSRRSSLGSAAAR